MKTCTKCGFGNDKTMRFCVECGNPLANEPQMVVPLDSIETSEKATEAVTDLLSEETITANRSSLTTPAASTNDGTSAWKIVIGLVVALSLVGLLAVGMIAVGVYVALQNEKPSASAEKPKVTPKRTIASTPTKKPKLSSTPFAAGNDPALKPTQRAEFVVQTDEDWQLSKIRTIGGENFSVTVTGSYSLAGIQDDVTANGVAGNRDRRLYKQFGTGVLLMRTHFPDGSHSNMEAVSKGKFWQNYPDENGYLEFVINDNEPDDNEGTLTISFEMLDTPDQDTKR